MDKYPEEQQTLLKSRERDSRKLSTKKKKRKFGLCNPSGVFVRMVVLMTVASYMLALYVVDELLGSTAPTLKKILHIDSAQIGLLYSSSMIPSMIFVVAGGLFLQKIGIRLMCILATLFMLIGSLIFSLVPSYVGKLSGRVLFGLGLGPIQVCIDSVIVRWFEKEADPPVAPSLELAFGIASSFGFLGAFISFNAIPWLLTTFSDNIAFAMVLSSFIPTLAVLGSILFGVIDYWASGIIDLETEEQEGLSSGILQQILELPLSFWMLFGLTGTCFTQILIFNDVYSTDYLHEKFHYENEEAARLNSIVSLSGVVLSPLVGLFISKYGHLTTTMLIACLLFGGGVTLLAVSVTIPPVVGLICIGCSLGILEVAIYSAVPVVVPENSTSTAFGFLSGISSLFLLSVPYLSGWLHDITGSYDPFAYLCAGSAATGVVYCLVLLRIKPELQIPTPPARRLLIVTMTSKRKYVSDAAVKKSHTVATGTETQDIFNRLGKRAQEEVLNPEPLAHYPPGQGRVIEKDTGTMDDVLVETRQRAYSEPANYYSDFVEKSISVQYRRHDDIEAEGIDVHEALESEVAMEVMDSDDDMEKVHFVWKNNKNFKELKEKKTKKK